MKTKAQQRISRQNKIAHEKRMAIGITAKDKKIIVMICKQMTTQEIADKLGNSKRTIDTSRLYISRILGVKNNIGIVIWAIKTGLVKLDKV